MESCSDNMSTLTELSLMEKKKKRLASHARLQYHEQKLKSFQYHLKQGTYPKHLRLSPYPKMKTVKGQALIKKACDDVKQMILLEMTNEAQEELTQEQKVYKSLQEKKLKDKVDKHSLKIKTLQNELKFMQEKLLNLQRKGSSSLSTPSREHLSEKPPSSTDKISVRVECSKTNGVISIDGWLYSIQTFPSM